MSAWTERAISTLHVCDALGIKFKEVHSHTSIRAYRPFRTLLFLTHCEGRDLRIRSSTNQADTTKKRVFDQHYPVEVKSYNAQV